MSMMTDLAARAVFLSQYPGCEEYWPDRLDECVSGPPFNAEGYHKMADAAISVAFDPNRNMMTLEQAESILKRAL